MRAIYKIRLDNVRALASKYPNQAAFADAIGKVPTQVSRFMGKNPTKQIGEDIAAEIESVLGLNNGFLDLLPDESSERSYKNGNYQRADEEHKLLVDDVANDMLNMTKDEARRLKQAMELLRGSKKD